MHWTYSIIQVAGKAQVAHIKRAKFSGLVPNPQPADQRSVADIMVLTSQRVQHGQHLNLWWVLDL